MQRCKFKSINGVHSIRTNQSCSAFTIASEKGVKVFSMNPLALLVNLKSRDVGSCTTAEIMGESSLMALVGGGGGAAEKYDEKSVVLMDIESGQVLLDITFDRCVLGVRFTGDKLVVILPEEIHIFETGSFKRVVYFRTAYNHNGLCSVSDNGVMVFPSTSKGHVQVVSLNHLKDGTTVSPTIINAHDGAIACVAVSHNGKMIATASQKGTLFRLFNVLTKQKEVELRRGVDTAVVYSMAFSACDGFLSTCSDKGTVHIFAVKDSGLNKTSVLGSVSNLLPVNSILRTPIDGQKSLAQFAVPAECPSLLAFLDNQTIVAISIDGTYQLYGITRQGDCKQKIVAYTLDMGDDFDS